MRLFPFKSLIRYYTTTMSSTVTIASQKVPIKGCSTTDELNKVLAFQPFQEWLHAFNEQQESRQHEMNVNSIDIQNVDYFGSQKIGFVKFKADVTFKDTGKNAPGIVFMVIT
jgi:ADP-sugar diphosphatase